MLLYVFGQLPELWNIQHYNKGKGPEMSHLHHTDQDTEVSSLQTRSSASALTNDHCCFDLSALSTTLQGLGEDSSLPKIDYLAEATTLPQLGESGSTDGV